MLRLMRKYQRSFVIYVFFGIIIAVFVVNFGPQSAGCTSSSSYAGKVAGKTIAVSDFQYAAAVWGLKQQQGTEERLIQLRGMVMDQLLARELLADDAAAMGLSIPDKEIEDMIFSGRYLALGRPRPLVRGDDGGFDYERFSRYARYYWGVTPKKFKDQQRRELLAEKLRQFLRTTIKVAEDEVRADYIHRKTQVKLAYVRFAPGEFQAKVAVDPKALTGFIDGSADKITKYYENNRNAFKNLPPQVKLQLIRISFADDAAKAAAKAKAKALLKRVKGGEDFGKVAAEGSDDDSRLSQGFIGWREAAKAGFGSQATTALKATKAGGVTPLIEADGKFLILKVLGERKGDLTLEQAKEEIGRKLYAESKAVDATKAAAAAFIKRAKAGEKLDAMFTVDGADDDKDEDKADDKTDGDKADEDKADDKKADAKKADAKTDGAEEKKASAPRSPLKLEKTAFFPLSAQNLVPRIGISAEITKAAFTLKKGEVGGQAFVVGKMVYLVAVDDRKEADVKAFDKEKGKLMEDFALRKWSQAVRKYIHERCEEAKKNNEIDVQKTVLLTRGYIDSQRRKGKAVALPPYEPCATLAQPAFPSF